MERGNPSHKWTTQTAAAIYCDTFWLQSFGTRNSSLANAKIYVFLYSFCFLRAISKYKPQEAYICKGDLREGFLRYEFGGLIFGGSYKRRGLFSEFYGILGQLRAEDEEITPCVRYVTWK